MIKSNKCTKDGCSLSGLPSCLIDGASCCELHYRTELIKRLHLAYGQWEHEDRLTPEAWKVITRAFAEFHKIEGDSYLSRARIRDRAFEIRRIDDGFEFKITRHPNAHIDPANMRRVVETGPSSFRVEFDCENPS